jgi:hypothetical protein
VVKQEDKCHKTVIVEGNAEIQTANSRHEIVEIGLMGQNQSEKVLGTPENGTQTHKIPTLSGKTTQISISFEI